ncbi:MAG: hypothetical protein ACI9N3_001773 [Colwellia sp.]|jgi:hypothetical protein
MFKIFKCVGFILLRSLQGMLGGKISSVLQSSILFITVLAVLTVALVCLLILFIV